MMDGFARAGPWVGGRGGASVAGWVQHGGRDAVATGVLAAVERRVGDLHDALREPALAGGHAVESAQSETGGHFGALAFGRERGLRDRGPRLAGGVGRPLIAGLAQPRG